MHRRDLLTLLPSVIGFTGCLRFQNGDQSPTQSTSPPIQTTERRSPTESKEASTPSPSTSQSDVGTVSYSLDLAEQWSKRGISSAITTHDGGFFAIGFSRIARYTPGGRVTWETPRIPQDSPHHFGRVLAITDSLVAVGTRTDDATTNGGELRGYSRGDGSLEWSLAGPADDNHHRMQFVAASANGTILGVSQNSGMGDEQEPIVYAVDVSSGELRWSIDDLPNAFVHDILVYDGSLYIGTSLDGLFEYEIASGQRANHYESIRMIFAGMAFDGTKIYTSGDPIQAFNISTGTLEWSTEIVSEVKGGPTVDGGQVYLGTEAGQLVALDSNSGDKLWSGRTLAKVRMEPVRQNNHVWITDETATLYAYDTRTGENVYQLESWDNQDGSRAVGVIDSTLLVSGNPTKAFNVSSDR